MGSELFFFDSVLDPRLTIDVYKTTNCSILYDILLVYNREFGSGLDPLYANIMT